jgi:hypothetical protein
MLRKKPDDRPQAMEEVLGSLESALVLAQSMGSITHPLCVALIMGSLTTAPPRPVEGRWPRWHWQKTGELSTLLLRLSALARTAGRC